ncbi:hypothetical protein MAR_025793, partial [Mya arenaria]
MLVYGVQYCDFVVLTQPSGTPSLVIIRVQRYSQFIDNLEKKCNAFLSHHLLPEFMTSKLRNKQVVNTPTEDVQTWCICEEREYGKMILCSNEDCQIGCQCHYGCVNVKRKPRALAKKLTFLIHWPEREEVMSSRPQCFKETYPK